MFSWFPFRTQRTVARRNPRPRYRRRPSCRPALESLETRCLLSGNRPLVMPEPWDGLAYGTTDGLGVNIHFTNPRPGEIAMLAAGGFRWVRMDLTWSATERQPGQYDFSAYDTLMNALQPYGIRALFILDYGNHLYDNGLAPHTDAGRQAFAQWAATAVQHFQGQGIIWELWNEPNISQFWTPAPNVQDYIQLGLQVGQVIRAVAPNETFAGPATSTIDFAFLQSCFQGGLLDYFDAVSVHPYRSAGPETAAADYARLRSLIDQYAPPGKFIPILSGEWGYSSVRIGPDQQGKLLPRQWLTNMANDIPLSIWYDWHDDGIDPNNPEHHYGTVANPYYPGRDPVYDPKPGYSAAVALTTLLSGETFENRLDLPRSDDYALAFSDGTTTRFVAWTASATPHPQTLPLPPGLYAEVSYIGAAMGTVAAGASGLTMTLSDAPVYFLPTDNTGAPAAPVNVAASPGDGQVTLTWTASAGATGYEVYRGTDPGGEDATPIARGVATTSFTNTGLVNGTTYYYVITAANSSGESGPSSEALATPLASLGFAVHVNFTSDPADVLPGYATDVGLVFGDRGHGFRFGWNQDNTANGRDRDDPRAPDERYDGLAHMQKPDNPNASWRIALPNGTYTVHLAVGDIADNFDASYAIDVQGVLAVSGTPTPAGKFFEGTVTALVTDGFLTVSNDPAAVNNKIDYIDITLVSADGVDFSGGFAGAALTLNGGAAVTSGGRLRLTDGGPNEARSAFFTVPLDVQSFVTAFRFQLTSASADGFTYTLQGVDPGALGGNGGGLGYQGIARSVAVKFDLYDNAGEGPDSTCLYTGGAAPTVPAVDLRGSGIDLHSGHVFDVSMNYDSSVFSVTIRDEATGASATQVYTIDIPGAVGGPVAYVGFTAGTGGLAAVQDVLDWTFGFPMSPAPAPARATVPTASVPAASVPAASVPAASVPAASPPAFVFPFSRPDRQPFGGDSSLIAAATRTVGATISDGRFTATDSVSVKTGGVALLLLGPDRRLRFDVVDRVKTPDTTLSADTLANLEEIATI
jgi:hypothetical protein